jgi:glycosyltransferase involved in cell wall biosynthesis
MKDGSLKILHLVRSLNVGGLEKVVVDLTKGLAGRDIDSYLGCLVEKGVWCDNAVVVDVWCGDLESRGVIRSFFDLCRYVKANKIDIIHTHNSHPHKYGAFVSLVTGIPLVHTKHGRNWPDNPRWVWFSRQLSRFTKVIVPVSKEIEVIVTDIEKVPAGKVVTIVNGVRVEDIRIQPIRERQEFVIGSIGRFSPEKQYPFLVRAFARFVEMSGCSPLQLILVGDGIERENIEAEIEQYGLGGSVLLPGMSNDVQGWLAKMDLFCLSSDQEGTSVTLLEAGAAGLPAVVTDVGGNGEIVEDGVTGIVVPSGDENKMCTAFIELADTALREKMGMAARERIRKYYSVDIMVDKYIEIYANVGASGDSPVRGDA